MFSELFIVLLVLWNSIIACIFMYFAWPTITVGYNWWVRSWIHNCHLMQSFRNVLTQFHDDLVHSITLELQRQLGQLTVKIVAGFNRIAQLLMMLYEIRTSIRQIHATITNLEILVAGLQQPVAPIPQPVAPIPQPVAPIPPPVAPIPQPVAPIPQPVAPIPPPVAPLLQFDAIHEPGKLNAYDLTILEHLFCVLQNPQMYDPGLHMNDPNILKYYLSTRLRRILLHQMPDPNPPP